MAVMLELELEMSLTYVCAPKSYAHFPIRLKFRKS